MRLPEQLLWNYAMAALLLLSAIQGFRLNTTSEELVVFIEDEKIDEELDRQMAKETYQQILLLGDINTTYTEYDGRQAINVNVIMDMALNEVRNIIRDKNLDKVPIPDFDQNIQTNVGIIKVTVNFKGTDGWAESLLSVVRKADAVLRLDGASIVVGSSVGLNTLQLGMNYHASVGKLFSVHGNLDAKVAQNKIDFEGSIGYEDGKCKLLLRSMVVDELGPIDIKATGMGLLNDLYSKLVTSIAARLQNQIRSTIEHQAKDFINAELDKLPCPLVASTRLDLENST